MRRFRSIVAVISFSFFILLSAFTQPKPISKAIMERGKKVYETVCMACHQVDGAGVSRMAPTLVKTKWVLGDKKTLISYVLNGLPGGEIEIDGETFANAMPPQESSLTDQQIADVLTFVRNSFGNKASAVSVGEVKARRGK